ncbi:MAG TPA: hypothetical protein VHG91_17710 [Longimicrobium sp.]|nr:hypothetical protein [Longimicrobium sp.]
MTRLRSRSISAPLLFAFVAASCADLPTSSSTPVPPALDASVAPGRPAWAADFAGAPHLCFTSVRTPLGPHRYRYGRVRLDFPASALAPDGATLLYRYRVQAPGEDPVVVANCRIPRTLEAVAILDRRLRVADRRRWRARDEQADGTATTQGCVVGGTCTLAPIYVSPYYPGGWGGGGGGGWDDGCGLNASVGDCWEDNGGGDEYDPGPDGTYRPECERDVAGECVTRSLSQSEWDRFKARIDEINSTHPDCAGAKQALLALHAQGRGAGRIRFWDGYDVKTDPNTGQFVQRYGQNLSDANGRYLEFDSHWVWDDGYVIVHEGLHLYFDSLPNLALSYDEQHQYIYNIQDVCV